MLSEEGQEWARMHAEKCFEFGQRRRKKAAKAAPAPRRERLVRKVKSTPAQLVANASAPVESAVPKRVKNPCVAEMHAANTQAFEDYLAARQDNPELFTCTQMRRATGLRATTAARFLLEATGHGRLMRVDGLHKEGLYRLVAERAAVFDVDQA